MSLRHKKILVTCGPTWVALDAVRVISNLSTGELGQTLAQSLAKAGAEVTLLEGPVSKTLENKKILKKKFKFFDELAQLLTQELQKDYAAVIHAAAVADYQPQKQNAEKLSSQQKELTLTLVPTTKLIQLVKEISPKTFLVGFKLETKKNQDQLFHAAQKLFREANCDLVVANTINPGYKGTILNKKNRALASATTRDHLVLKLVKILDKQL